MRGSAVIEKFPKQENPNDVLCLTKRKNDLIVFSRVLILKTFSHVLFEKRNAQVSQLQQILPLHEHMAPLRKKTVHHGRGRKLFFTLLFLR